MLFMRNKTKAQKKRIPVYEKTAKISPWIPQKYLPGLMFIGPCIIVITEE
jgi:hypothetical protein